MSVLREEGQACAEEEGDVRGGDLSKEVQAPEGLRGQRRKARKREVQNDVTDDRWSMVDGRHAE